MACWSLAACVAYRGPVTNAPQRSEKNGLSVLTHEKVPESGGEGPHH